MQFEGWVALEERCGDLGVSGGSLERPALRRLLSWCVQVRVEVPIWGATTKRPARPHQEPTKSCAGSRLRHPVRVHPLGSSPGRTQRRGRGRWSWALCSKPGVSAPAGRHHGCPTLGSAASGSWTTSLPYSIERSDSASCARSGDASFRQKRTKARSGWLVIERNHRGDANHPFHALTVGCSTPRASGRAAPPSPGWPGSGCRARRGEHGVAALFAPEA